MPSFRSSNNEPSAKQLEDIKAYAEGEIAGCLTTDAIDRDLLSRAVCEYYKLSGNSEPRMLFCRSPLEACTLSAVLSLLVKGEVKGSSWSDLDALAGIDWWHETTSVINDQIELAELSNILSLFPRQTGMPFVKSRSLSVWPQIRFQSVLNERLRSKMQSTLTIELKNLGMPEALTMINRTEMDARAARIGNLRLQLRAHILFELEKGRSAAIIELLNKLSRKLPELPKAVLAREGPTYINQQADRIWWGSLATNWMARYIATAKILGASRFGSPAQRYLKLCEDLSRSAFACIFLDGLCIASQRPFKISLDEEVRLHNSESSAMDFKDGYAIYSWHGANLPDFAILNPESITAEIILKEANVTVRRALIEKYGFSRFVLDLGAQQLHQDDFGILYRVEIPRDEPLMLVKVVNSTAEPDGSFKDYYLRVPPSMQTAKQAVAWTFGLTADQYDLAFQS
jgi:hypothetical protein